MVGHRHRGGEREQCAGGGAGTMEGVVVTVQGAGHLTSMSPAPHLAPFLLFAPLQEMGLGQNKFKSTLQ